MQPVWCIPYPNPFDSNSIYRMARHLARALTLIINQTRSRPSTPQGARPRESQVWHLPFLYTSDDSKLATEVKSKKTTKKPFRNKEALVRKPTIPTGKGKRKAPQDDEDTATVGSASVNDDKAAKSAKSNAGKDKTKTKVAPVTADLEDETSDVAMPKKKKMRKLNMANPFASAQPQSLDWANQFNVVSVC